MTPRQGHLQVLEAALAGGDICHHGAQHDRHGADVVGDQGLYGLVQAMEGVAVLLLAAAEGIGHLRRGFHVFFDDSDGEVGLEGAGLDGGLQDVREVEFAAKEGHHGGEAIVGEFRVGADILHRVTVVAVEVLQHLDRLAAT